LFEYFYPPKSSDVIIIARLHLQADGVKKW
jgi:hypothetical protein